MAINTTIIDMFIDNFLLGLANLQLFGANIAGYFASNTSTLGPILFIGILVASVAGAALLGGGGISSMVSKFKK